MCAPLDYTLQLLLETTAKLFSYHAKDSSHSLLRTYRTKLKQNPSTEA